MPSGYFVFKLKTQAGIENPDIRTTVNEIPGMTKNVAIFVVKSGIAIALIFWLFRQKQLDFSLLTDRPFNLEINILLGAGVLIVFAGLLLMAWRLWLFVRFKGFPVSYQKIVGITLASSFLGVVLPGLVGGDALKAVYLSRSAPQRRMDMLASVFIDRFIGLLSLFLLGMLAACIVILRAHSTIHHSILLLPFAAVSLMGFCVFILTRQFNKVPLVQSLHAHAPKRIWSFIRCLRDFHTSPRLIISAFLISLLNHLCVIVSFVAAAVFLNDKTSLYAQFTLDPLAMGMNIIPLTPGGIGVTESAFAFLFQSVGSPNGAMIGLLGRLIQFSVFMFTGSIALIFLKLRSGNAAVEPSRLIALAHGRLTGVKQ